MKRPGFVIRGALAVYCATALLLLLTASPLQAPEDRVTLPTSCKPSPPVEVSLRALGGNSWALYVTSTMPSPRVKVWLWSQSATGLAEKKLVWEGSLAKNEGQSFNVAFTPGAGAQRVWACIETLGSKSPGRSFATFELSQKATMDPGTLKTDPSTGEKVWEYTSSFGGSN